MKVTNSYVYKLWQIMMKTVHLICDSNVKNYASLCRKNVDY